MQQRKVLKLVTNVLLSLALALAIVTVLIMMGCTSVKEKRDREIWLIDNESMVLYRVADNDWEYAIPLNHPSSKQFMCISRKEFDRVIEDMVKK
jgi:hypothetical protein